MVIFLGTRKEGEHSALVFQLVLNPKEVLIVDIFIDIAVIVFKICECKVLEFI